MIKENGPRKIGDLVELDFTIAPKAAFCTEISIVPNLFTTPAISLVKNRVRPSLYSAIRIAKS